MFKQIKENIAEIKNQTSDLVQSNIAYYKLWTFKVITKSANSLLKVLMLGICLVMVLVFFSFAGALAIGEYLNNYALGFLIIGGIYLLISFVIYLLRNVIEKPIISKLSEIFYNDED